MGYNNNNLNENFPFEAEKIKKKGFESRSKSDNNLYELTKNKTDKFNNN